MRLEQRNFARASFDQLKTMGELFPGSDVSAYVTSHSDNEL